MNVENFLKGRPESAMVASILKILFFKKKLLRLFFSVGQIKLARSRHFDLHFEIYQGKLQTVMETISDKILSFLTTFQSTRHLFTKTTSLHLNTPHKCITVESISISYCYPQQLALIVTKYNIFV